MSSVSQKEVLSFFALLLICVVGTVGIILFAIGLETGNPFVNKLMSFFLRHYVWVLIALFLSGFAVYGVYKKLLPASK